jgi:hypothetical protein
MKGSGENICSISAPESAEKAIGYFPSGSVAKQPTKQSLI